MPPHQRTATTDGNAVITTAGRLITDRWRDLHQGTGKCRAYRGYTWVMFPVQNGYIAQVSGPGLPARRRRFHRQEKAVHWLRQQADAHANQVSPG